MSLLNEAYEDATIINKITVDDGRGGVETRYEDGARVELAFTFDTSTAARVASKEGANNRFTIWSRKNINLQFHDVVRRERDGKIFRVTSDGDDNKTPKSASLDIRQVEAEEWSLPNG